MHQTLFVIPNFVFEGYFLNGLISPLLAVWLVIAAGIFLWAWLGSKDGSAEAMGLLPFLLVATAIIHFVLPNLQVSGLNPDDPTGAEVPLGLAIQGYGFFMLLGILIGVSLCVWRAHQVGLNPDRILALGFWMIITGVIGARLFYVIQKRDQFQAESVGQFLSKLVDMTSGGLVVYGALIGGIIAAIVYLTRVGLPVLKVADVIAPGMVAGLCLGRIGCLMNACCYGGVCEVDLPAIQFPAGSAPYVEQLADGSLLGISRSDYLEDEAYPIVVDSVDEGSLADRAGITGGDRAQVGIPDPKALKAVKQDGYEFRADTLVGAMNSPGNSRIPVEDLPDWSLWTHPTQIYSSINAALLCLVLWFYYPFRRSEGEVFALMLMLYALARFLLELIRIDEAGVLGTPFTISQMISFGAMSLGIGLFFWIRKSGQPATDTFSGVASAS
ncbi:MAG: prolipoprotein diacylglyceryl transferase [Planctomycetota bacterium]